MHYGLFRKNRKCGMKALLPDCYCHNPEQKKKDRFFTPDCKWPNSAKGQNIPKVYPAKFHQLYLFTERRLILYASLKTNLLCCPFSHEESHVKNFIYNLYINLYYLYLYIYIIYISIYIITYISMIYNILSFQRGQRCSTMMLAECLHIWLKWRRIPSAHSLSFGRKTVILQK